MIRKLGILVLALSGLSADAAPTFYVTDSFTITMRTGQGTEFQIIRTLPSGTPLEVIDVAENGYSQVRTRGGETGWVLSRFLVDTPVARDLLASAEKKLEQLSVENERMREEKASLEQERTEMMEQLAQLTRERQQMEEDLAELTELTAAPRRIKAENESLRERIASLESESVLLKEKNTTLQRGAERAWFLTGAGVLLGGFLLGLIIPRIRWRKRSSWDTF